MKEQKEVEYREPWHSMARVVLLSLPVLAVVGIGGAILYLLYTWSAWAAGIVAVIVVWVLLSMILTSLSMPKDEQDD